MKKKETKNSSCIQLLRRIQQAAASSLHLFLDAKKTATKNEPLIFNKIHIVANYCSVEYIIINPLINSKLIKLFQLLSPKEVKELGLWLASPWSKNNKYFGDFFKIIERAYPKFPETLLQKKVVYQQLFPKKNYDNASFNNLISLFTKEVENYLAHLQLNQSETLKQQLASKELLARTEVDLFEETTLKLLRSLNKKTAKSAADNLLIYQLNELLYFQPSGHHRYQSDAPTLAAANNHLDAFYLLEKYRYIYELASRDKILQGEQQSSMINIQPLLDYLQQHLQLKVVELYEFRLGEKVSEDWQQYLQFKKLFLATFAQLAFDQQQAFLIYCINDTIALNSKGQAAAIQELYEWYQFGFEHQLLLQNNSISEVTYNNIILTACHLKKQEFLKTFIQTYKNKLPKPIQVEAYRWSMAQLNFATGNYDETIAELIEWLPKNNVYAIQAKITLLKANFKLVLTDVTYKKQFNRYCLTFERYIQRNTLYSEDRSTSYLKYIQYTRKICQQFYLPSTNGKWEKLLKAMDKEKILFGKSWLKTEIALIQG